VREITEGESNRVSKIVRRPSGSLVTRRWAQMVMPSEQGMDVAPLATVVFTSKDRVREVIHDFDDHGFDASYPKHAGGRPPTFTLPPRRGLEKSALALSQEPMSPPAPSRSEPSTRLAPDLTHPCRTS
jgi:hypothetical protein